MELVLTEIDKRASREKGPPGDTGAGTSGSEVVVHMSQLLGDVKGP
ncbi:hypothetical protein JHFBIEKO_3061 [Methylobacterium mesophilicum]|nr:hypothetical protein JHFBIEKO_3061 [Methylobacterium mesophilicum]